MATLVDFVAALHAFRKKHPALTHDRFLDGREKHGVRGIQIWLSPSARWRPATELVASITP